MSVRHPSHIDAPSFLYPWEIPRTEDIDDIKAEPPVPACTEFEEDKNDDTEWTHLAEDEIPLRKLPSAA